MIRKVTAAAIGIMLLPSLVFASISFDSSSFSSTFTAVSGSETNEILVTTVFAFTTTHCTALTYGGVPMTNIDKSTWDGSFIVETWYLLNPPTGSNSLSATTCSGTNFNSRSYKGAAQFSQPDSHKITSGTSATPAGIINIISSGAWATVDGESSVGKTFTSLVNWTARGVCGDPCQGDSNGTAGPGSFTQSASFSGADNWYIAQVGIVAASTTASIASNNQVILFQ